MKGQTHSTEEIIRILRQADGGQAGHSVCRAHNISEQTFYRWKKKYGDMNRLDAKRLK
jgi:putative transposase